MAQYDLAIEGGRIVDGSDAAPVHADLAIRDGLVAGAQPGRMLRNR